MSEPWYEGGSDDAWVRGSCIEGYDYEDPEIDNDRAFVSADTGRDGAYIRDVEQLRAMARFFAEAADWLEAQQKIEETW